MKLRNQWYRLFEFVSLVFRLDKLSRERGMEEMIDCAILWEKIREMDRMKIRFF